MHLIIIELLHYDNGHKETLRQMTGSNKNSQIDFKEIIFFSFTTTCYSLSADISDFLQWPTIQTKTICGYYFFPIEMWNHIVLFLVFQTELCPYVLCLYGFTDIQTKKFY